MDIGRKRRIFERKTKMTKLQVIFFRIAQTHRGEANAIKRDDMLYQLNRELPVDEIASDRTMRKVRESLPKVLSSSNGYFLPSDDPEIAREELLRYKEYRYKKAYPEFSAWDKTAKEYPHLLNPNEIRFDFMGTEEESTEEVNDRPSDEEVEGYMKRIKGLGKEKTNV